MRIYDILKKKRLGDILSKEEISFFIDGYVGGSIPDYQASALLMAICINGMNEEETFYLTEEMLRSGEIKDMSVFGEHTADKHSTGGVGDKTTLIVAPIAAAMGMKVAKMSGRGLGHTGGTIDKLEAIPGYRTNLSEEEFKAAVVKTGVAVISQSGELVPADKKLYALRDVTATVDSIPLIASSIMSKKLACGAETIVLDVKVGSGAFMKDIDEARRLGGLMVKLGKKAGRKISAVITDMDCPLGFSVGNALEVNEAVEVLKGNGAEDLKTVSLTLASEMASLSLGLPFEEAYKRAEEILLSGSAFEKMKEWVEFQGGDKRYLEEPGLLLEGKPKAILLAKEDGFLRITDTEAVGSAAAASGAGRTTKEESIDLSAGIILRKKTGDAVRKGDVIAEIYAKNYEKAENAKNILENSYEYVNMKPKKRETVIDIIR